MVAVLGNMQSGKVHFLSEEFRHALESKIVFVKQLSVVDVLSVVASAVGARVGMSGQLHILPEGQTQEEPAALVGIDEGVGAETMGQLQILPEGQTQREPVAAGTKAVFTVEEVFKNTPNVGMHGKGTVR